MADHEEQPHKVEFLMEKLAEKIHGHYDDTSSSSSDSDDDSKKPSAPPPPEGEEKPKIFPLFGRERPVHKVLGGGKPSASMADHEEQPHKVEFLMEKLAEKIHGHYDDTSSSSSDSDDDSKKPSAPPPPEEEEKPKIFPLFGRERPVHKVLGGGKPGSSSTLLMTRPRHRSVADLVDLDVNIFNDSISTLIHRRPSIILQAASEPVDRSWWLDSTWRGGDVAGAVIVAVLVFLILLYCRIGFWRLLWVRSYSFLQMSPEAVHVRTISVAIMSMWIVVNLVSCALEVARPFYLSNDMPVGNNAPTTTARGGGGGNDTGISSEESANWGGPQKFTFKALEKATNYFASDLKLGQGASGTVYKGHIGNDREPVAVKIITSVGNRRISEYIAEMITLIQLSHTNLVKLKGYCHESNEFALVYEFIGGGTLYDHLFKRNSLLTWERRFNIALGLASALRYLHKKRPQCVIHRDIKSSNIMLNEAFVAKLGDFGLAKLVDHNREPNTTQVVGTPGYWDPEYHQTGKASKESDIYSFGVVLLEIVCGRRVVDLERDPQNLVVWVWKQYGPRKLLDAVDTRLGRNFNEKQAKALMMAGLWCAHPVARYRLSIEEAMDVLNLKAEPPKLPRKMTAYFY